MSSLFKNCKNLNSIDLSSFETSKATNMNSMFSYIGAKYLDLSRFNTLSVNNFDYMFEECRGLTILIHSKNCQNMISHIPEYVHYELVDSTKSEY